MPPVQATFVRLTERATNDGRDAVAVVLAGIGLRMMPEEEGERRMVTAPPGQEQEGGGRGKSRNPTHPFVNPSLLPHAPSLSSALQDWLIGLFRDDASRAHITNQHYFRGLRSFWQCFEQALPRSLLPSPSLSNPDDVRQWPLEMPHVQTTFLQLRETAIENGNTVVKYVLAGLGLRLTRHWEGDKRLVPLLGL